MKPFLRNRSIRLAASLAIVLGTAGVASLTALSTTQASADPASVTGYVGVGSDVTQDFFDSLSGAAQRRLGHHPVLHTAGFVDGQ